MVPLLVLSCAAPDAPAPIHALPPSTSTGPSGPDTGDRARCLDFDTEGGVVEFVSGGARRRLIVHAPDPITPGLPMLFFWHGGGQRAEDMVQRGELGRLAQDEGVLTIAPDSMDRDGDTWELRAPSPDIQLFEDVVDCLVQDFDADPDQVHVAGFSFGGLLTTVLTMERSEMLASALTFSGGLDDVALPYTTPAAKVPVLVSWGGLTDIPYGGDVPFEPLSLTYAALLRADGHVVVLCNHDTGHRVPGAAPLMLVQWSLVHRRGVPSPRAADLGDLPEYCVLAE